MRGWFWSYSSDIFQERASGEQELFPHFPLTPPSYPFWSDRNNRPLLLPITPPLPGPHISQEALNSLALFDLGRSGVSVRYKPMVNHE